MGGKSAIYILGERFIVCMSSTVPIFKHGQPPGFVIDPVVLVCQLEAAFRGLAVESFRPCPFLNHLPGQLETKLKPLDGGVAGEIGCGSAEGFAETRDGCGEAVESCGHRRIP